MLKTTIDGLLNKRVTLEQPAEGFRVAIDTVLLAAAVPAKPDETVLDLGCGVGGAMLALACRVPGLRAMGIECDDDLLHLCKANIARNDFAKNCEARWGDVTGLPGDLVGRFDHVLMNPPFHDEARHDVSDQGQKRRANSAKRGDLPLWISGAEKALKPEGSLTLIHRYDRRAEILQALGDFTAIDVITLMPKAGASPKRIIVRANKTSRGLREGTFTLHESDGKYTPAADAVLRDGEPLVMGK